MEHAVLLVLIFGTIAIAHHTAQHKLALHSVPYVGLLSHHTLVYSGLSPLHFF